MDEHVVKRGSYRYIPQMPGKVYWEKPTNREIECMHHVNSNYLVQA